MEVGIPTKLFYHFLAKNNPELSKQWNYKKNYPLTPEMFEPRSGKTVWWVCKNNQDYEKAKEFCTEQL